MPETLYQAEGRLVVLANYNSRTLPQILFADRYLSFEIEQELIEQGFKPDYFRHVKPDGRYRITVERLDDATQKPSSSTDTFKDGWAAAIMMLAEHAPELWAMGNLGHGEGFSDAVDRIETAIHALGDK